MKPRYPTMVNATRAVFSDSRCFAMKCWVKLGKLSAPY